MRWEICFLKELQAKSNIICKLPTTGHLKVKQQHILEIDRGWSMRITSEKWGDNDLFPSTS